MTRMGMYAEPYHTMYVSKPGQQLQENVFTQKIRQYAYEISHNTSRPSISAQLSFSASKSFGTFDSGLVTRLSDANANGGT
jgi:hypothetical protein